MITKKMLRIGFIRLGGRTMIDFAEKVRVSQEADRTLETILSKRYDNFDQYEEVNKIMDLKVAKVVIKRLLDKLNSDLAEV